MPWPSHLEEVCGAVAVWLQLHAEGDCRSLLSLFNEMHKIRKPVSQDRKVDGDRPQMLEPLSRIIPFRRHT